MKGWKPNGLEAGPATTAELVGVREVEARGGGIESRLKGTGRQFEISRPSGEKSHL